MDGAADAPDYTDARSAPTEAHFPLVVSVSGFR
jgi:hypothetical protein